MKPHTFRTSSFNVVLEHIRNQDDFEIIDLKFVWNWWKPMGWQWEITFRYAVKKKVEY